MSVSDAESLGAQDRIPPEAVEAMARLADAPRCSDWGKGLTIARLTALAEAAYPLILRAVCQELAEALRARPERDEVGYRETNAELAEFVESFGASPGGE